MTTPTTGKTIERTCAIHDGYLMDFASGRRLRLATATERRDHRTGVFRAQVSLRTFRRATDQLATELVVDRAQGVGQLDDVEIPF